MLKTGPDGISFVENALTAARDHSNILSAIFS